MRHMIVRLDNEPDILIGNNLQKTYSDAIKANCYPLELCRCINCGHFQLAHKVDPEILFATDYTYLSGVGRSFVNKLHMIRLYKIFY